MRREIPLILTFVFGAFFVLSNFVVWSPWKVAEENVNNWLLIVIAFTYVLGVGNVLRFHGQKISRRETGWAYSAVTVAGLFVMVIFGIVLWFLPQTEGATVLRFRALKEVKAEDALHVSAPAGSGDLFDIRVESGLVKDANGDGAAGEGDEIEYRIEYSYSGAEPVDPALISISFDGQNIAPLDLPGEVTAAGGTARPEGGVTPTPDTVTPTEGTATPPAGAVTPTQDTVTPPEGTATPTAGTVIPTEGTTTPTEAAVTPTEGTTTPAAGAVTPAVAALSWNAGRIDPSAFGAARAGNGQTSLYTWFYDAVYTPMQSTMFALLAFFISSAAFRAFRIRSTEAVLLGVTALVVILGSVPVGEAVWGEFPTLVAWVMNCLQTAGKRAILIGAALGAIATGLKMTLGKEKGYLSGD